jgi:hypothetical protein
MKRKVIDLLRYIKWAQKLTIMHALIIIGGQALTGYAAEPVRPERIIGIEYDEVISRCDSLFYFATNLNSIRGDLGVARRLAFDAARTSTIIHIHAERFAGCKDLMRRLSVGARDTFNANLESIPALIDYCNPLVTEAYQANSGATIGGETASAVTVRLAQEIRKSLGI